MLTYLEWDSRFFGYKIGKFYTETIESVNINDLLAQSRKEGYHLIYFSFIQNYLIQENILKEFNGKLVDKKTTFLLDLSQYKATNETVSCKTNEYKLNTANEALTALAVSCGIYSRFNVDKQIGHENFLKLYQLWINNSVSKKNAEKVLIYEEDNTEVGLITLGMKDNRGDIGLIGVNENYRGRGIGKELILAGINYFKSKNTMLLQVVTQGNNLPACGLYQAAGFKKEKTENLYHFWL